MNHVTTGYHPFLFILTGGPGSGKTTVLEELGRRGYTCVPEVARQIIQEQVSSGGRALPWDDTTAYTHGMLQGSITAYLQYAPTTKPVCFDRGIPDTLAYARLIQLQLPAEQVAAALEYRYHHTVFLFPPWREIYCTDAERKQSFEEAVNVHRVLQETYTTCGYNCLEVPRLPVRERAAFIIRHMEGLLYSL